MSNPNPAQVRAAQRMSPGGLGPNPPANALERLLPRRVRGTYKLDFNYVAEFTPLAASGTASVDIGIQADSDFVFLTQSAVVTQTDNITFLAAGARPFLVTLQDTASGRNFQNSAVHMDNSFGTAQLPHYLAFPILIRAGATFRVTVQNLSATAYNVRLCFEGFKSFPGTNIDSQE